MSLSRNQKAIVHVAKVHLRLSDAEYRAALIHIAGVTSSTELDRDGFAALMGFFEHMGFRPLARTGPDYGQRPGMASFAQIELIRNLWREYTHGADEGALNKWLLRCWKVSCLRFMTSDDARKAITALKSMKARAA